VRLPEPKDFSEPPRIEVDSTERLDKPSVLDSFYGGVAIHRLQILNRADYDLIGSDIPCYSSESLCLGRYRSTNLTNGGSWKSFSFSHTARGTGRLKKSSMSLPKAVGFWKNPDRIAKYVVLKCKMMKLANISSSAVIPVFATSAFGSIIRANSGCEYIRSHRSRCCWVNVIRLATRRARASSNMAVPIRKSPEASRPVWANASQLWVIQIGVMYPLYQFPD
jgi:hypothetical protein